MPTSAELEQQAVVCPHSLETNRALAEAYTAQGQWVSAVNAYQKVAALFPEISALNVNRIRLGISALAISSLLGFTASLLQPEIGLQNPIL